MSFLNKTSMKFFESSIRADEKIIKLLLKKYDETGDDKCLKKIQKHKDSIERTKKVMRKFKK